MEPVEEGGGGHPVEGLADGAAEDLEAEATARSASTRSSAPVSMSAVAMPPFLAMRCSMAPGRPLAVSPVTST